MFIGPSPSIERHRPQRCCAALLEVPWFDGFEPGLDALPRAHFEGSGGGIEGDMAARGHRNSIRRVAGLADLLAVLTTDDQQSQWGIVLGRIDERQAEGPLKFRDELLQQAVHGDRRALALL